MENRIVVVTGIKGGTGKSTITSLLAHYLADRGIGVIVFDADIQATVRNERTDDKKKNPDAVTPWDVHSIIAHDDFERLIRQMKRMQGVVLIDCPGSIDDPRLQLLYKEAYMAVIPFRYDRKNVQATYGFYKAFRKVSRAMTLFVPNMVSPFEGFRRSFREAKAFAEEHFLNYDSPGITPRIMDRIELRDSNTLAMTSRQRSEVKNAFNEIIRYLNIEQ